MTYAKRIISSGLHWSFTAIFVATIASIVTPAALVEASVQYNLNTVFANTDGTLPTTIAHPSGLTYLTANFANAGTDTVTMTLSSNLSSLGLAPGDGLAGYFIRNLWLQLGPSPSSSAVGLTVSLSSVLSGSMVYPSIGVPLTTHATSDLQADSEDKFNVSIYFDGVLPSAPAGLSTSRFDGSDIGVFTLTRTGLTEDDFRFLGAASGGPLSLVIAAEIVNRATLNESAGRGTFFVGAAVPEAASIAVWSLLVAASTCLTIRRRFA
jgi:hypothetical protein